MINNFIQTFLLCLRSMLLLLLLFAWQKYNQFFFVVNENDTWSHTTTAHKYAKKENKIDEAFTCRETILYTHYSACRIGHIGTHAHTFTTTDFIFIHIFVSCCWKSIPFLFGVYSAFVLVCSSSSPALLLMLSCHFNFVYTFFHWMMPFLIKQGWANIYCPTAETFSTKTCFLFYSKIRSYPIQ